MGNTYSDGRYQVVTRKWFGLTKKHGGDAATGYTFGTTDATTTIQVARWYPKGPIRIIKFGAMFLATKASSSAEKVLAKLYGRGGSASLMATFDLLSTSAAINPFVFASIERTGNRTDFTRTLNKAGEYIMIRTATPATDKGTAANTSTTGGTVAFFIDYKPSFDETEWDDEHR